jgi:hypothetical protein
MKNCNNSRLSGGGLAIKGMRTALADEILALPPRRSAISSRIEQVLADVFREWDDENEREARYRRYEAAEAALVNGLETALHTARSVTRAIKGRDFFDRNSFVQSIAAANDALRQSGVMAAACFLSQSGVLPVADGSVEDFLRLAAKFYGGLADGAGFTLSALAHERRRALLYQMRSIE